MLILLNTEEISICINRAAPLLSTEKFLF